ncbi:uncharacterized protein LOC131068343 isoform X2 [Cryptomeria japonica]|uniref:uncharacterized protein LOC131068343 isoform X2 n=1 Tax=Cryptomeria japonica TaxID=3369 RepID=UPI0025AD496A|nr:uncharacterized protein LOC131068343 isoform X2 [Cryptomeria japonica]
MRLVRGSILSSEACSTSKAARILRRFLCSDGGTDDSVKSFLKSAARSLESMGEGSHSSLNKSKKKKMIFETPVATGFENPNEGLSGSGQEPQTQASSFKTPVIEDRKHSKKSEKSSKLSIQNLPDDTGEEDVIRQKTEVYKHARKSKKNKNFEEEDAGRLEKTDFDSYATPTIQKKFENVPRANGFRPDDDISTLAALNQFGIEISGQPAKKKRKKDKEHQHNENHDGDLKILREQTDLELKETHATHKKLRKLMSPDRLDEDNGNILVSLSSRKSEQGKHPANEGDDHYSRKAADEEQQSHSIKKKKKDKTPKESTVGACRRQCPPYGEVLMSRVSHRC